MRGQALPSLIADACPPRAPATLPLSLDIEHRNGWGCVRTVALPSGSTSNIDTGNPVEMTGRGSCHPPSLPHGSFGACEEVQTAPIKRISPRAFLTLISNAYSR
jgi:hypothetical protein